jgi:hypothetical protein
MMSLQHLGDEEPAVAGINVKRFMRMETGLVWIEETRMAGQRGFSEVLRDACYEVGPRPADHGVVGSDVDVGVRGYVPCSFGTVRRRYPLKDISH